MKVLVTGSSGLVGSALVPLLTSGGHRWRAWCATARRDR